MSTCTQYSPDGRFACTLPFGHRRWHVAEDVNDDVVFAWPPDVAVLPHQVGEYCECPDCS